MSLTMVARMVAADVLAGTVVAAGWAMVRALQNATLHPPRWNGPGSGRWYVGVTFRPAHDRGALAGDTPAPSRHTGGPGGPMYGVSG